MLWGKKGSVSRFVCCERQKKHSKKKKIARFRSPQNETEQRYHLYFFIPSPRRLACESFALHPQPSAAKPLCCLNRRPSVVGRFWRRLQNFRSSYFPQFVRRGVCWPHHRGRTGVDVGPLSRRVNSVRVAAFQVGVVGNGKGRWPASVFRDRCAVSRFGDGCRQAMVTSSGLTLQPRGAVG